MDLKIFKGIFIFTSCLTFAALSAILLGFHTKIDLFGKSILQEEDTLNIDENKPTDIKVETLDVPCKAQEDIELDFEGNLFVNGGSVSKSEVYKIDDSGNCEVFSSKLAHPVGLAVGKDGSLFITNFESSYINEISKNGVQSIYIKDDKLKGGGGIIVDNNGILFNTYYSSNSIFKVSKEKVEVYVTSKLLDGPIGLAYDSDRNHIYVGCFNTGRILQINPDKSIEEVAHIPAHIGHIAYNDDYIYATGWKENLVYQISVVGVIHKVIGSGVPGTKDGGLNDSEFFQPNGICVSRDGKYVFVTQGNVVIRKIIMQTADL